MEKDQEFLKFVIEAIVENPGGVEIKRSVDEMGVLLTVKVDSTNRDTGRVIGFKGGTIKAIRHLVGIVGFKNDARVTVKIEEPEGRMPRNDRNERKEDKVMDDLDQI
jgi:predicted RNA-binding protein YlqC (UPF0109 family)